MLLLVLALSLVLPSLAQFRDNVNVSLFTGGYAAQQNGHNRGHWYGMYVEYMPIKTASGFNLGFAALASQVGFVSQDSVNQYKGSSTDFGFGLAFGKYAETLTRSHSGYFGANLMIKRSQDLGEGLFIQDNGQLGRFNMQQKDLMLTGELNINLLKSFGWRENIFPRTQLRLTFQEPLRSERNAYWNNSFIRQSALWNKAAYSAELKQSLTQSGRMDLLLETKIWTGYYHYKGDKSNWLAIGPEFALKMRGWDDFLSVYALYKWQIGNYEPHLNSRQFVVGLNFMPFNIKKGW